MTGQPPRPRDDRAWLAAALARLPGASVAVFGDFCIDAYWSLDPADDEFSIETGLPVQHVRDQRYGLGGAGNVAANLVDLGVGRVRAIGVVGTDPFGPVLVGLLRERGVRIDASLIVDPAWQTLVYAKPMTSGAEGRRLDFGGFARLSAASADALVDALDAAAASHDAVVLNQQVPLGVCTPDLIARINAVVARHPRTRFVADSRHRPEAFAGVVLKLNAREAARLLGADAAPGAGSRPGDAAALPEDVVRGLAAQISSRTGRCTFITRGERGLVAADGVDVEVVPGIRLPGRADPVGAGDSVVATVAAMLGRGERPLAAARVANLAAAITTRKLQTTGTATPAEILALADEADYVCAPELADGAIASRYVAGTRIEIIRALPRGLDIRACVFDHDGTLSTLREGWERIMETMMLRAIAGDRPERMPAAQLGALRLDVREFIDASTGAPTLVQMQWLVARVRRAGCVPGDAMPDAAGYKRLFAQELAGITAARLGRLQSGAAPPAAFQVRGTARVLRELQRRGILLFLVSGTDHDDVVVEARALGYADVFNGGIFGAGDDAGVDMKSVVLDRLAAVHGLAGHQFAVFGDGPVEIRESRRRGGVSIGVASDEVDGAGVNGAKRRRLVRAGADLVVADYDHWEQLLEILECRSTSRNC